MGGLTGRPLSPMTLYVVVYTMIWNWVVVVEAKETGSRSFGREVQSLA